MICQPEKFDLLVAPEEDDDEANGSPRVAARRADRVPDQIRQRPVLEGSLDPGSLQFSSVAEDYSLRVTLFPREPGACAAEERPAAVT